MTDIATRFWAKVSKVDGSCWTWLGRKTNGYGRFKLNGRRQRAHRVAWVLTHGEFPPSLLVCHHCDNPACVNPSHLFLGTPAANTADMIAKGRQNVQRAKLSAEIVLAARERHAAGETYRKLAQEFGVSFETMRNAVRGFSWKSAHLGS